MPTTAPLPPPAGSALYANAPDLEPVVYTNASEVERAFFHRTATSSSTGSNHGPPKTASAPVGAPEQVAIEEELADVPQGTGEARQTLSAEEEVSSPSEHSVRRTLSAREEIERSARISDAEKHRTSASGPPRRHGVRERVLHFTPSWYSVTMGTGVLTTLLLLIPWGETLHRGLRWPALVYLVFDIFLYILFTAAFTARYIIWPQVLPLTLKHPQKSMFVGTIPMGLLTIISGVAQLGTKEFNLGIGFTLAASGLWWFVALISLLIAIVIPFISFTYQQHFFEGTTAALLLPVVPCITVAATGSTLAEILMDDYPTYAYTIVITSYAIAGVGIPLALFILTLYLQRLILFKAPPRDVIISVMLPLGPCGQGGEALLHLGRVALELFPRISRPIESSGVPQLFDVGQALYGAGIVGGLLLWGLGMWWFFIAFLTLTRERLKGELPFSVGFWGMTFPLSSLAICTARLGQIFNSRAFDVGYTILFLLNLALWFGVAIPTALGAWQGTLFAAPCLATLPLDVRKGVKIDADFERERERDKQN